MAPVRMTLPACRRKPSSARSRKTPRSSPRGVRKSVSSTEAVSLSCAAFRRRARRPSSRALHWRSTSRPKRSAILTANKSYGEWAEVFSGDAVIATAILDRLLHHSTTISIKGESYRLKARKKAGLTTLPASR